MKALAVSQPHASLIAYGPKWVENRRWYTSYRGRIAIHAGKGTQYLDRDELRDYPTGCVLGTALLIDCVSLAHAKAHPDEYRELLAHEYTEGPYCLVLTDKMFLPEPIPWRGAQGLWEIPSDALAQGAHSDGR